MLRINYSIFDITGDETEVGHFSLDEEIDDSEDLRSHAFGNIDHDLPEGGAIALWCKVGGERIGALIRDGDE